MDYKKQMEEDRNEIITHSHAWSVDYFVEKMDSLIQRVREGEREKTIKMLWSIHEDETDKEMEVWNHALDLAIFRLKQEK